MNGKRVRMLRLFDGDLASGRVVIAALDHGMFQGVQPGLERMDEALANSMGADAMLTGPAMIERCADVVARRAGPVLISRAGFTSAYCFPWNYHEGHTRPLFDPSYLLSMGAEIVVSSLQLRTGSERIDAENAEVWGRVVVEKERLGMPLIGEFHPTVFENVDKDEWHDLVKSGCRILCELGADMIKTFYTDDRFSEIVEAVPVPIFILGSKKLPRERDVLDLAERAVRGGARGVVIGRNIFQAKNPAGMIRALKAVVKDRLPARDAEGILGS